MVLLIVYILLVLGFVKIFVGVWMYFIWSVFLNFIFFFVVVIFFLIIRFRFMVVGIELIFFVLRFKKFFWLFKIFNCNVFDILRNRCVIVLIIFVMLYLVLGFVDFDFNFVVVFVEGY